MAKISSSIVPIKKNAAIVKSGKFFNGSAQQKRPKVSQKTTKVGKSNQNLLGSIEKKVVKIDKVLKSSLLFQKKESEKKRKQRIGKSFADKEKELEKKKPKQEKGPKLPEGPKLGLFDIIRNYIGNVIFGFFAVRLIDFLPRLLKLVPTIVSVGDFIIDMSGKLLDGLVTFIDWGYKAIDGTHRFIKNIGGEGLAQNFDKFIDVIDNVIEIAVIAALATADTAFGDDFGGGGGGRSSGSGPYKYDPKRALIRKKYGDAAARIFDNEIANGKTAKQAVDNLEKKYIKTGRITPQRMTGSLGGTDAGSKVFGRGLARAPQRLAIKGLTATLGKGGAKAILGTVRPLLKRLPIIGALIDFGLSVALRESPGRAAFKAIGAGLLGSVGAAIGSVVPIAGNIIGGIVGGMAGDAIGGALYDMFFGNKKPKQKGKSIKAAGGGTASTRGGKSVTGPAKRTIKKKTVRVITVKPQQVKPGASVGGEDKIKKLFPEESKTAKEKTVNPFGYMKSSSNRFSKPFGLGGLFSLVTKSQLGEEPTKVDYQNAAQGLMAWMQKTQILSAGGAFAEGGKVDASMFNYDQDMKNAIAKSIQDTVAPSINDVIKDLQKNLMLKPLGPGGAGGPGTGSPDDLPPGTGSLTGNTNAEKVFNYLIGYGFTPQAAAGVIGNLMQESGVNPNSNQNGGGKGRGMMQWSVDERWAALTAWAQSSGKDPRKLDTQVEWMMREMKQRGTLKRLPKLTNVKAAVDLFEDEMEDAGTPMMEKRYSYAADALASFGGGGAGGADISGLSGKGGLKQYLTGDHTDKAHYDQNHDSIAGVIDNYHDHLAFNDKKTTVAAYNFFKSKNIQVTELLGNPHSSAKLASRHSGPDHPSGLAFDVPGAQWGGTPGTSSGPTEYRGSAKVRSVLKEFMGGTSKAMFKGGRVSKPTKALIGEKGPEFVFDADTTSSIGSASPGLLERLNTAKTKKQIVNILQSYASYEMPYGEPETIIINNDQGTQSGSSEPQLISLGGGGGGSRDHQFEDSLMHG